MKHLELFASTGQMSDPMIEALRDLYTTMDPGRQTSNSFAPIPGQSPFGRYEQAMVINEVADPSHSRDVRKKLACIVDGTIQCTDKDEVVRDLTEFLYDLENRALHKYSEQSNERGW
ncbi:MAG: hypothetical protein V4587_09515 [Acidobacteriota bacterium]